MARFLLLLILLLTLPRSNDVLAQSNYCYCTSSWRPNTTFGNVCTANADCWACAPGAYSQSWQQAFCPNYQAPPPVQVCNSETQFQTQSCPANYSGIITQSKTKICPSGTWTEWQTVSNTCTPNPPTCQVSSQQQTLQCQTGFTGSITQTRSSTCPNPYGSPQWQPWVTTSDTCKKSVNNPTNPVSPVNPASPTSQTSTTSAPTIQSSPVTVQTPNTVPNSEATPTASTETPQTQTKTETKTDAQTTTGSQTTSTTQVSPSPPPRGKVRSAVGLVLSLELFVKPGLQQANVFSEPQLVSGIPNNILTQDLIMMDLLQQPSYNQPFDAPDLGFEQ